MMIDIDHVSFQYSGAEQENLQDFNLQIKKGECVVLTGESGCGKTCVTRLINTLIPHFYEGEMSGAVLIDGVDTRTIQPHDLSDKIGSVFQNPRSQFFSLDTDSEIVFGMENKGMPYQVMLDRYQQTIRELHIEKLKDRNLFDLSGGQKQTIAFASVYALNPDIFVLDEPSSNLDPEAIQELRRLLLLIKAQGKTIVVSEHRLYFLNGIADRIVLMEHGKLKQSWSASDFALFNTEQIKALGLRSYTTTRLELPDTMPSRNEPPAVEVKDLAIGYEKGEPVAQHLNFRVYPGEIVGVVGKNGCGKSTLARTLCGLQKELRGEVLYKNSMVPSKRRIRKAYLVMQDPDYQLFTDSVYQELLLVLSDQKDKDEKRIDDILDELNLTIYKERHPMSLGQIYDGRFFPCYYYEPNTITVAVTSKAEPEDTNHITWLFLPMVQEEIDRALLRGGITDPADVRLRLEDSQLPNEVDVLLDMEYETLSDLNELAVATDGLSKADMEKLGAVVMLAEPKSAAQIKNLAESLDLFDFAPGAHSPAEYGKYMIRQSGHFDYDENLDAFYDYEKYGTERMNGEDGVFTDRGYIAYKGYTSMEEVMNGGQSSHMEMGGLSR